MLEDKHDFLSFYYWLPPSLPPLQLFSHRGFTSEISLSILKSSAQNHFHVNVWLHVTDERPFTDDKDRKAVEKPQRDDGDQQEVIVSLANAKEIFSIASLSLFCLCFASANYIKASVETYLAIKRVSDSVARYDAFALCYFELNQTAVSLMHI